MNRYSGPVVVRAHGNTLAYRTSLENLRRIVPFGEALISTTLPRGGLQVVQPREVDPVWMRLYVRDLHLEDAVAWQAMSRRQPVRLSDLQSPRGPQAEVVRTFGERFLTPQSLKHYVAIPLRGPILSGFPGVLQLFRSAQEPDFSDEEIRQLGTIGEQFDVVIDETRRGRHVQEALPLSHHLACRQFACTLAEEFIFPDPRVDVLDSVLEANLREVVLDRLQEFVQRLDEAPEGYEETLNDTLTTGKSRRRESASDVHDDGQVATRTAPGAGGGGNADRLLIADSQGDNWVFRLALYVAYPALTGTSDPVAVVSLQPECESWSDLRPSDFQADEELARLIPALQYMQDNYTNGSSLHDIARTVHLSPFHFHRRFTELLGITPKHYLFDCQVKEAKRQLAKQELSLIDIARRCGFAHQSHFTSRFKQATGLTPTRWRRLATRAATQAKA